MPSLPEARSRSWSDLLLVLASTFVLDRAGAQSTQKVSMDGSGHEIPNGCKLPSISADGRFVAFAMGWGVYVRDLRTGITTLESQSTGGVPGNNYSGTDELGQAWVAPALSGDGRYVAFLSAASNLVAGDTNGSLDVFVRDRLAGTTTRVSVSTAGVQGGCDSLVPAISGDGRFVAFQSCSSNLGGPGSDGLEVFRHDRWTGRTVQVSVQADGSASQGGSGGDYDPPSQGLDISADGRWVAFESYAPGLIPGGVTQYFGHIYVRDCLIGQNFLVSASATGTEANGRSWHPSISADGRFIAFESNATNLVAGDTNQAIDVFVKDMQTGAVHRASVSSTGAEADSHSRRPRISADGRHVGFFSLATNLDQLVGNTFAGALVHDTWSGATRLVSLDSFGVESNGVSGPPAISGDGRALAFMSTGTNLVLDDTHANMDIFVHHMPPRGSSVVNYCTSTPNSTGQNARIEYTGAFQLSSTSLELRAAHCPASRIGLFFYGDAQAQIPFGSGWRCVGGSLHRLPLLQTGSEGTAQYSMGPLLGTGSSGIQPGSTWNFQFVFRDSLGAGSPGFNLSDALSATFAP